MPCATYLRLNFKPANYWNVMKKAPIDFRKAKSSSLFFSIYGVNSCIGFNLGFFDTYCMSVIIVDLPLPESTVYSKLDF